MIASCSSSRLSCSGVLIMCKQPSVITSIVLMCLSHTTAKHAMSYDRNTLLAIDRGPEHVHNAEARLWDAPASLAL